MVADQLFQPAHGADPLTPHDVYTGGAEIIIPRCHHWATAAKARLDEMMAADARNPAA